MHCQTGKEYAKYCVPMGLRANGHHSVYCIMEIVFQIHFLVQFVALQGWTIYMHTHIKYMLWHDMNKCIIFLLLYAI